MGLLNDIWWLLGVVMAAPIAVPGIENVLAGSHPKGVLFLAVAAAVLFLPEYIRWRLLGGTSPFERVPLIGTPTKKREE